MRRNGVNASRALLRAPGGPAGAAAGHCSPPGDGEIRQRTDQLLGGLRAGRWTPRAWAGLLAQSVSMSVQAAAVRPRAAAEVTMVHATLLGLSSRGRGRAWVTASWALAITHLGLLGPRRSLGAANLVTLARANLPAVAAGRWTSAAMVAGDLLDGRLARRRAEVTVFGSYADSVADAAFWTWFAARHEPSRLLRGAALAAWTAPPAALAAISVTRGTMPDVPRPALIRPAAALAGILTARAIQQSWKKEKSDER
jgi:hypothetical protein